MPKTHIDGLIPAGTSVRGSLEYDGTLWIDGEIHGDIKSRLIQNSALVIGPRGRVFGTIEAERITIFGQVTGRIHAHGLLVFENGAHVVADEIAHQGLTVRDGAHVEGSICPTSRLISDAVGTDESNVTPLRHDHRRSVQQMDTSADVARHASATRTA